MKVSELLMQAKAIWLEGRMSITFHEALRRVTDDHRLRSDAHMYMGRAHFSEEEKINRATALAAIDEHGLGELLEKTVRRDFLERHLWVLVEDPPEGPETW